MSYERCFPAALCVLCSSVLCVLLCSVCGVAVCVLPLIAAVYASDSGNTGSEAACPGQV